MKNEEIKKLYGYCKSQGYNESEEKFEEDLKQLVIEEIESDNLKNISGGKIEMNKKVVAGLLSALSLGSSMNSVYADVGKAVVAKPSNNLKKILLGGAGATLAGGGIITAGALAAWKHRSGSHAEGARSTTSTTSTSNTRSTSSTRVVNTIKNVEDARKIFDTYNLDDTEILNSINGDTVHFYWKVGDEIRTASRPKMSDGLAGMTWAMLGHPITDNLSLHKTFILLGDESDKYIASEKVKLANMFPNLKDSIKTLLARARIEARICNNGKNLNFSAKMDSFPSYERWEEIFRKAELDAKNDNGNYYNAVENLRAQFNDCNWALERNYPIDFKSGLFTIAFYPEVFEYVYK